MTENRQSADKVPKKAQPKGGSRKGKPNKTTAALKDMISGALDQVGGQTYLAQQAVENPAAFMSLLGKILPKDVNVGGQDGNPIVSAIEIVIVDPKA